MVATINPNAIPGRWIHSHEEDTASEMIFRPASFAFPPSRGRQGFEFRPDRSYVELAIGPTDKQEQSFGHWKIEENNTLVMQKGGSSGPHRVLYIKSASPERLAIQK